MEQVAQLSQRDSAAEWVSYGQKRKTGTGRQYLVIYGYYRSIFNHCDVIGQQSNRSWWKTQNKGYYAVQSHSRSPKSESIDTARHKKDTRRNLQCTIDFAQWWATKQDNFQKVGLSQKYKITRCSAITERPRCRVRYSFSQKWKTWTRRQYFTDIIGLSSTTVI